jgi:hypothetical protein
MMGLFDGEWLSPIGALGSRWWSGLCLAVDEGIDFVLNHLSWVVAAVSGTAGLVLVAFIMGGGLASDAAAYHRDQLTPLKSGGVIDQVAAVSSRASQAPIILARAERDDSWPIDQTKTADYMVFGRPEYSPIRPRPRRPIEGSIDFPPRSLNEQPMLDVTFRRLGTSVVRSEQNPDVLTRGRIVDSLPDTLFIERLVRRLRQDNWQESLGLPGSEPGLPQDAMPDSPLAAVRDLESRVRVTPGVYVAEHDLRVEKTLPEGSATGEITIQISLTNMGQETIDGLLVREFLPIDTQVRRAEPRPVLRDDTLTWLVDGLRPAEELMLRFTVLPANPVTGLSRRDVSFESMTEVSALTAVTSRTDVVAATPEPVPFPSDRRRRITNPEIVRKPDLQLKIEEPLEAARVGEWTQILFTLANLGNADANSVRLSLTLDSGLDHSDLLNRPASERRVYVEVPNVAAGQTRRFRLEVRPTLGGETLSTAEVLVGDSRVDRRTFRLFARDIGDPIRERSIR